MDDELFLPWAEVARAVSHYLYAKYHWPAAAQFKLSSAEDGLILTLMKSEDEIGPASDSG
jgi:hypothetical protein